MAQGLQGWDGRQDITGYMGGPAKKGTASETIIFSGACPTKGVPTP